MSRAECQATKVQEYICTDCGYAGSVVIRNHAGVLEVIYQLEADHLAHSPDCKTDDVLGRIRVRNPLLCSPEEWEALKLKTKKQRDQERERS